MGMYCYCGWKMTPSHVIDMVNKTSTTYEVDQDGCTCDWEGWTSLYDWPPERKNKDKTFSEPEKEGKYLVRASTNCGDRYEEVQSFSLTPRTVTCGYTGKEFQVHWSGDEESQPYAWRELKEGDEIDA